MKKLFDRKAVERCFSPGEVLVLLPVSGSALTAHVVDKRVTDTSYVLLILDLSKKQRICHINKLKSYFTGLC